MKSREAWRDWRKSSARPEDVPSKPDRVYKKQGWVGFPEFLGYEPSSQDLGKRGKGKGKGKGKGE